MIQDRRCFRIRQWRDRDQIGINVAEVLLREYRRRIGRHRIDWATHHSGKHLIGQRVRREVWTARTPALPNGAMTHVATNRHIDTLSVVGVAYCWAGTLRMCWQGKTRESRQQRQEQISVLHRSLR